VHGALDQTSADRFLGHGHIRGIRLAGETA
jgi:hypothetical protein